MFKTSNTATSDRYYSKILTSKISTFWNVRKLKFGMFITWDKLNP